MTTVTTTEMMDEILNMVAKLRDDLTTRRDEHREREECKCF